MNVLTEFIPILALICGFLAWINREFKAIDKRLDMMRNDINGLGSRLAFFEQGTCELLGEQINQLKSKMADIENKL